MREKHIQIIGVPKTGTTWLWNNLTNCTKLRATEKIFREDKKLTDEYTHLGNPLSKSLKEATFQYKYIDQYIQFFSKFDVSCNADPCTYRTLSDNQIKEIHTYTTDLFIIFRNPYELLLSWYNFSIANNPGVAAYYLETLDKQEFIQFPAILNRWKESKIPLTVMFYDDLKRDPFTFFEKFCRAANLEFNYLIKKAPYNETKYTMNLNFTEDQINNINKIIVDTQELLNKDLSHWLR